MVLYVARSNLSPGADTHAFVCAKASLSPDANYAIAGARAVKGCGGGAFDDLDALDIEGIHIWQSTTTQATLLGGDDSIDDVQRLLAAAGTGDRGWSAQDHRR